MSRKKNKKRQFKTTIYVLCEGSNTEPNYFKRIKEQIEADESKYWVMIEVIDTEKTDALGLVLEAIQLKDDYTEIWVVFDKDGYTKHKEAFDLAKQEQIKIAFSSIAFEHWILLHFEKNMQDFEKSKHIIAHLLANAHFTEYTKGKHTDIYPYTKKYLYFALENAAWLRQQMTLKYPDQSVYDKNPYTDIDILVRKLLNIETVFYWGELDKLVYFNDLEIIVSLKSTISPLVIEVSIHNKTNKTFLVNVTNQDNYFHILTERTASHFFEKQNSNQIIEQNSTKTLELICSSIQDIENSFFCFKDYPNLLYIPLVK